MRTHKGDPCIYCGLAHDNVPVGDCQGAFPEIESTLKELPKTLKWLRGMRHLKLREVKEITGLSVSFLSDVECGRTKPSLNTLSMLIEAYRTPISLRISL